jgi:hypothetical protein
LTIAPIRLMWAALSAPFKALNWLVEKFAGKSLTEMLFGGGGGVMAAFAGFIEKIYRGLATLVDAAVLAGDGDFKGAYGLLKSYASPVAKKKDSFGAAMQASASVQSRAGGGKPKPKADNTQVSAGLQAVNEGGRSVRNVTVNITNLVRDLKITAATAGMGTREMADLVKQELIRAVSGAEQNLATN